MPNGTTTATMSVGLDFRQADKDAAEYVNKVQRLFTRGLSGNSLIRPLGQITSSTDEFSKSMAAANARVIAFGASAGIIFQVANAVKSLASATVEVDKSLTELNVLFGKSKQEITAFGSEIFKIAKNTGQSFSSIAEGAQELARQGLGASETLTRLRDASVLSRQSGLDLADSVETLTAALNSFSNAGLKSTEVINKFANVDASFAVSSRDLAEALKRVGSTAQDAGVDIDNLIGFVTAAQQTTARGGAVIGNALKTIFTRIDRPEVLAQLEQVGVAVRKVGGEILPTTEILKDFAGVFSEASDSQQSYLAELVGSVYQINILKALLGDLAKGYGIAAQATAQSAKSQNEAIERNEAYNKSLSATLNKAKETFRQIGSQVGELTLKPVVNSGNNILETLFGDIGEKSDSFGTNVAEGILKGIGNFLSGPGLIAITAIVGKLFANFAGFAKDATVDFLGINKFTKEQAVLQTELNLILASEPKLRDAALKGAISQVEVEKILLSYTRQRIAEETKLKDISSIAAGNLLKSAQLGYDKKGLLTPRNIAAGGFVPNSPATLATSERLAAVMGGYEPGDIRRINIPGIGSVTYNSKEQVKDFGFGQPAILPPQNSGAGQDYKKQFSDTHGFDPYSAGGRRISAMGHVPKYAAAGFISDPSTFRPFTPLQKRNDLGPALDDLKRQVKEGTLDFTNLSKTIKNVTDIFSLTEKGAKALENSLTRSLRYEQNIPSYPGKIGEQKIGISDKLAAAKAERERLESEALEKKRALDRQAILNKQTESASSFSGFFTRQGRKDVASLRESDPQAFAAARRGLDDKIGRSSLTVSLVAPLVGGLVSQAIGKDTKSQRGFSSLAEGAGNVASYAGLGGAVGGLPGLLAGAAVGGALEIPSIIKAFKDNIPDLARNLELMTERFKESSETLSRYISLEDKLNSTRDLTADARVKIQQQRDEVFATFNSDQKSKVVEASKRGTAGLVELQRKDEEEKEKIARTSKLEILLEASRQKSKGISILESELPKNALKIPYFQSPEAARLDAFNQSRPNIGGAPGGFGGDIFRARDFANFKGASSRVFRPEDVAASDELSKTLATSLRNQNGLVYSQSADRIKTIREDFLKSSESGDTKALLEKVLNFIPDDNVGDINTRFALVNSQKNSPGDFLAYLQRFLTENLSEDFARKREERDLNLNTSRGTRIDTVSDFARTLFQASEAVNNFTTTLENVNRLALQNAQSAQKGNSLLREGELQARSPFITSLAQERLRGSFESENIREQNAVANTKLSQDFAESLNRVISTEVLGELDSKIKQAIGKSDENIKEPKDIRDRALRFIAPINEFNSKIQSNLSRGDAGGADEQIGQLIDYLQIQNQKLLPALQDVGGKEDQADLKVFIEKIIAGVSNSRLQLSQNRGILNAGSADEQYLSRLQTIQKENQIKVQKQIGFGGGIQGFLEDPTSFGRNISRADALRRLGDSNSDASLVGLGGFEKARNLQSLGVDVQKEIPTLFSEIVNNLSASIDKALTAAGVELETGDGQAKSRDIALKQAQAQFPTNSTGSIAGLISSSESLYKSIESTNTYLSSLVTDLSQNGLKIQDISITALAQAIKSGPRTTKLAAAPKIEGNVDFGTQTTAYGPKLPSKSVVIPFKAAPEIREPSQGLFESIFNDKKIKVAVSSFADSIGEAFSKVKTALDPFTRRFPKEENDVSSRISRSAESNLSSEELRATELEGLKNIIRSGGQLSSSTLQGTSSLNSLIKDKDINQNSLNFYSNLTPNLSETQDRLSSLSSDRLAIATKIKDISAQELEIHKKVEANQLSVLDGARKILALREKEVSIASKAAFLRGEISAKELNGQFNREAESKIKSGDLSGNDIGKLFASELTSYGKQDFFTDIKDGAIDTAKTIKGEFSGAFKDFARGTKDAGDAFRDFGLNVLERITDITTDISTNLLFSGIGEGLGSLFGGSSSGSGFASIFSGKKYSKGGRVKGGSGVKDDVPALLTEGEYVINKRAVAQLGAGQLDRINSGTFTTNLQNSFDYNDGKRPTAGGFNVSSQLSSIGQTDEDNPANRLKFQREEDFINYLQGKKAYDKNRRLTLRNFERAKDQRTISGFISAGIAVGGYGLGQIGNSNTSQGPDTGAYGSSVYSRGGAYGGNSSYLPRAGGGMIFKRYATGGNVFGGDSLTDKVPSLLTGGEYVVKKQAVDKYGSDFMDAINKGKYKKLALGGSVTSSPNYQSNSEGGETIGRLVDSLDRFNALMEKNKETGKDTKDRVAAQVNAPTSSNNISITVNVESNGNTSEKSDSSASENEDYKKMAELIKQQTLKVITEQQRNGGLLATNR